MKKFLLISLALIFVLSTAAVAEVQNVKVGGTIRIRAFSEENRTDLSRGNIFPAPGVGEFFRWNPGSAVIPGDDVANQHWSDRNDWIEQLTDIYVEADLTDNVLVRITLEACANWGSDSTSASGAGIGTPTVTTGRAGTESWAIGVIEGWIQISELYYSPLSIKVGRQFLNYGTGFLISDKEAFWNFDAVKAVLDFYPWTIDLVYAKLAENTTRYFQTRDDNANAVYNTRADWNLYGINIAYAADFWNVEAYVFGTKNTSDEGAYAAGTAYTRYVNGTGFVDTAGRLSPTSIEPCVFGLRADVRPIEQLDVWGEIVYEWGSAGSIIDWSDAGAANPSIPGAQADYTGSEIELSAWAADCGATYTFDWTWEPAFTLAYTYASGEDNNVLETTDADGRRIRDWKTTTHAFYPLFGYDYSGYAFSPRVSNIHIFNAGLSLLPLENVEIVLDYYHYAQVKNQQCELGAAADLYPVVGNHWIDNGGVSAPTSGLNKDLGDEIDVVVNYDYSEDLSCQLVVAYFMPGSAFDATTGEDEMVEVRGELQVNF